MYSYLVLVIVVPMATAVINCRTACRTCHGEEVDAEVLEVHCAMCRECEARRRERTYENESSATNMFYRQAQREGTPDPDLDDCPSQPPCSDFEEDEPTSTIKLTMPDKTTTTTITTTTTATTTTRKPCPIFKPCKQKISTPPPPPPIPIQMPVPIVPMIAAPMYPMYPYMGLGMGMGPVPPLPYGPMGPGYMHDRFNPGKMCQGHNNNNKHKDSTKQQEEDNQTSGSGEYHGGASIVLVQTTPLFMNLKGRPRRTGDDFVYMYVGVPKNSLKS